MITSNVANPEVVIPCEVRCVNGGWRANIGAFVGHGQSRPDAIRALHAAIVHYANGHEVLLPTKRDDLSFECMECHAG